MSAKRKALLAAVLVAVAAGAAAGVWLVRAERADDGALTLYGNVEIREVNLGFRVSGRVEEVRVEEGDRVEAGAVLAVLDAEPYRHELQRARAEVEAREAAAANAERTFERQQRLLRRNQTSQQAYDDARAALRQARAELEAARAALALARTRLEDTELIAPDDGVVITRAVAPGAMVAPQTTAITLSREAPVWVRTYVAEPDLGRVSPGMRATVLTDSGGRYRGQVGFISPRAEFTPKTVQTTELRTELVYRVRVVVTEPGDGLRRGMPVTVRLPTERRGQ